MARQTLRDIPSVNSIMSSPEITASGLARTAVLRVVREEIARLRDLVSRGETVVLDVSSIAQTSLEIARKKVMHTPAKVINATGVVIHTNLGRAPLAREACEAIREAIGYCDLEFDLETGERGSRQAHLEQLLTQVTGAEQSMAVNNNAAAVLLVLTALAHGKEVIVSRGELVEIGGSFRVPDIMRQSGARLVEVGTTNRTRLSDYEGAITSETALILKVHTSNYRIVGFTESVSAGDLASLAHRRGLPVFCDAGSGLLVNLEPYGLGDEPTIQSLINSGCDVVAFSGDKLMGGPQAGVVCGTADLVNRCKRHPLARALRLDKTSIAALAATLRIYAYGTPETQIPVLRMLTMSTHEIERQALRLLELLRQVLPAGTEAILTSGRSCPGGGSFPGVFITSPVVSVRIPCMSVESLAGHLRRGRPAVVARVQDDALLLDPRTLDEHDLESVAAALHDIVQRFMIKPSN